MLKNLHLKRKKCIFVPNINNKTKPMKKFFTTIMVALLGATSLMAQEEETTFSFYRHGELIPNGSTVTISEYDVIADMGATALIEMQSGIVVKNNYGGRNFLLITATGIENFDNGLDGPTIQVCPGGSCIPWSEEGTITSKEIEVETDEINPMIHIGGMFPSPFSYKGSMTLTAASFDDDEDATTITVVFDTNASSIKPIKNNAKCEVFNLCGKKIADTTVGLSKGIYIVKQNGTSRKMVIK